MKRIILAVTVLAVSMLASNSCILDPKNDKDPPPIDTTRTFKNLSQRDHVLINLETAYNQRHFNQFEKLLDANFTFFFSQTDIDSNFVQDESWGRDRELRAAGHMFDPTFAPPNRAPIDRIDLSLSYAIGEDKWAREEGTPDKHPGEDWFEKTAIYNMTIQAGQDQFISTNIRASFIVRYAEIAPGDSIWRMVAWRDDI
jgi:hypothetical protein